MFDTLILFYWLIAGWALYISPPNKKTSIADSGDAIIFIICIIAGGIVVPAKILAKWLSQCDI